MRRRMTWMAVLGLSIAGATASVGIVRASMADGFTGTTVAVGRFGAIDVFNLAIVERHTQRGPRKDVWLSSQKSKGESDLYIQSNVWLPGGTTGWHSHPGTQPDHRDGWYGDRVPGGRSGLHAARIYGRDGVRRRRRRSRARDSQ